MKKKKEHEAIVFVLDIGSSMSENIAGETDSYFDQSILCIQWILQRKLFSKSKDELALVLCGTSTTSNPLATDFNGQYQNITVAKDLATAHWNFLKFVRQKIQLSYVSANFMDALVVALNILADKTEDDDVSSRKIVLFSNFGSKYSSDKFRTVLERLNRFSVELNVIGPDLDNISSDESVEKSGAQKLVKKILEKTDGEFYIIKDAIPQLMFYQTKKVRPVPWNVNLNIGTDLHIPVSCYVKIQEARPKSLKSCFTRVERRPVIHETSLNLIPETSSSSTMAASSSSTTAASTSLTSDSSTSFTAVASTSSLTNEIPIHLTTETSFHRNDEAQTEVHRREAVKAYKYGTTLVPFTEEDMANMKYKGSEKCLSVLGFSRRNNVKIHYFSGAGCRLIVGRKNDKVAIKALSALIHALYETDNVAIVRYCYSTNSGPKMAFLAPFIKLKYEALIMIFLPFMEDIHHFKFAPLTKRKRKPSDAQLEAIDDFITKMTLTPDDDEELLKSRTILNPYVQHFYQCVAQRAMNESGPRPEIEPQFMKKLSPSEKLLNAAAPAINRIKELFPLKDGSKKKRSAFDLFKKKPHALSFKRPRLPGSLQDGISGLIQGGVSKIGTITPVEDFMILLKRPGTSAEQVCKEMQNVVVQIVSESFGNQFYSKALNCVKALRTEAINVAVDQFNNFLKEVKNTFGNNERKKFWQLIRQENISLIDTDENSESKISPAEAKLFLEEEEEPNVPPDDEFENEDDIDDLIAML